MSRGGPEEAVPFGFLGTRGLSEFLNEFGEGFYFTLARGRWFMLFPHHSRASLSDLARTRAEGIGKLNLGAFESQTARQGIPV